MVALRVKTNIKWTKKVMFCIIRWEFHREKENVVCTSWVKSPADWILNHRQLK